MPIRTVERSEVEYYTGLDRSGTPDMRNIAGSRLFKVCVAAMPTHPENLSPSVSMIPSRYHPYEPPALPYRSFKALPISQTLMSVFIE
ncbi:MAG TPA: hypothetical protein VGM51_12715 [Armatimonadota bacterium]|jgi:hypothetical protein